MTTTMKTFAMALMMAFTTVTTNAAGFTITIGHNPAPVMVAHNHNNKHHDCNVKNHKRYSRPVPGCNCKYCKKHLRRIEKDMRKHDKHNHGMNMDKRRHDRPVAVPYGARR